MALETAMVKIEGLANLMSASHEPDDRKAVAKMQAIARKLVPDAWDRIEVRKEPLSL